MMRIGAELTRQFLSKEAHRPWLKNPVAIVYHKIFFGPKQVHHETRGAYKVAFLNGKDMKKLVNFNLSSLFRNLEKAANHEQHPHSCA